MLNAKPLLVGSQGLLYQAPCQPASRASAAATATTALKAAAERFEQQPTRAASASQRTQPRGSFQAKGGDVRKSYKPVTLERNQQGAHKRTNDLQAAQWYQEPEIIEAPFAGQKGRLRFTGDLQYAHTRQQAVAGLRKLLQAAARASNLVVGFDTETPASFVAGKQNRTALVQLCYHPPKQAEPICLLIPLQRWGVLPELQRVLKDPHIIKVGVGLAADVMQLQREYKTLAEMPIRGLLDLDWMANACYTPKPPSPGQLAAAEAAIQQGLEPQYYERTWGLAALLEQVTEYSLHKSKRITCSNWGRYQLTDEQIDYASTDAYAGLVVFHSLCLKWAQVRAQIMAAQELPTLGNSESRLFPLAPGGIEWITGSGSSSSSSKSYRKAGVDKRNDASSALVGDVEDGSSLSHAIDVAATVVPAEQQTASLADFDQQQEVLWQDLSFWMDGGAVGRPLQLRPPHEEEMKYTMPLQQLTKQIYWDHLGGADAADEVSMRLVGCGIESTRRQLAKLRRNQANKLNTALLGLGTRLNRVSPPAG